MEACLALDEVSVAGEGGALVSDDGVKVFDGGEVTVCDGAIDVDPEGFGGLEFRGVGGQVDQADALRDGEAGAGVPARAVKDQKDDAVGPRARIAGEEGQRQFEGFLVDAVGDVPVALAGRRRDEGSDVKPFEAVVHAGDGSDPAWGPDPAQDRLQADAVPDLVGCGGKGFDDGTGVALPFFRHRLGKFFLKSACASGVAALAWRGRGT